MDIRELRLATHPTRFDRKSTRHSRSAIESLPLPFLVIWPRLTLLLQQSAFLTTSSCPKPKAENDLSQSSMTTLTGSGLLALAVARLPLAGGRMAGRAY